MIDCSISILTKNEARNIGTCLEAVLSQKNVGQFEVILVDSGSTDTTVKIAQRFPICIEQIPAEAFHHARTRNLAARLGKGSIIVNLSGGAIPASDLWLHKMLANFDDPGVAATYGRQLPKEGATMERCDTFDAVYGDKRIVKDPAHCSGMGYHFYHFSDVNSAIRRSVWEAMPYPEDIRMFEDLAIAKQILDAGGKIVYEPEAPVFHSHHHGSAQLFRRYFDIGYTFEELKIWDAPGTRSSMLRDFREMLRKQVHRPNNRGTPDRLPTSIGLSLAKSAGLRRLSSGAF
jgi:rhamnosyltransferase